MNRQKGRPITDLSKYVDFFGSSERGSIANASINEMLEEIERLYENGSTPSMLQIFVHDKDCDHCKASRPYWEKLKVALSKRLFKYKGMAVEIMEPVVIDGNPLYIDDVKMSGGLLYKYYKATGVPFILQNFKVERLSKKGSNGKSMIVNTKFFISYTGEIQPFSFLSSIFNIPNRWMDFRISIVH